MSKKTAAAKNESRGNFTSDPKSTKVALGRSYSTVRPERTRVHSLRSTIFWL